MALLPILTAPHPILKTKSTKIEKVNKEIRLLLDNMLETMYHDKGIGLAANQIGVTKQILVADLQDQDDCKENAQSGIKYPLYIVNPEILSKSDEMVIAEEGCLSLPDQCVEVERAYSINLRYLDYYGNKQEIEAKGWLARVIQHEIDHLNGKLLIDHLSTLKKSVALRKLTKLKRDTA